MLKIYVPEKKGIYKIAAEEFVYLWKKVTGSTLSITDKDDGKNDLVIMGSDAVNVFAHVMIIENVIPQFKIRTDTDDYQLISAARGKRKFLFIAGGRRRALLYGVYHFFEKAADCRYFWDGDIIPQKKDLNIDGIDIVESPRFEYRGLRYFAHRSLNRFQAEHWDFEEWKHEILWMLKKRLNMFMLRIGLDDLFQKAFPDVVKYPDGHVPETMPRSYDDRNLFWSLKYRGELRKKILAFARERDLIHPEDVGTMTHWYSRTPYDFLKYYKPSFIPQTTNDYSEETGLVWDIRKDENLERYYKLTQTHIKEYGAPDMFHTIGLAERMCYKGHAANHQMKLYTYRRIISRLRKDYPHAPLLIGTWDFGACWTPDEVKSLLRELNPQNTLIFDYTSDTTDEVNNFMNWGVVRHFPWIFGIFHAYEPATELCGNYDQIERRLPIAAEDPMCRGMVFWPECSHADTLMLDFMPSIAWKPDECKIDEFLPDFCKKRYLHYSENMYEIWRKAMPLVRKIAWNGAQDKLRYFSSFSDIIFKLTSKAYTVFDLKDLNEYRRLRELLAKEIVEIPEIFRMLGKMSGKVRDDFMKRDIVDLGRTMISRLQSFAISSLIISIENWRNGECKAEKVKSLLSSLRATVELEAALLDSHEDFSLNNAFMLLRKKHKTFPDFEKTLKGNAENFYCRTYASELFHGIYLPEFKMFESWINKKIDGNDLSPLKRPDDFFDSGEKKIQERFYEAPLKIFAPDHKEAFNALPKTFRELAKTASRIVK